MKRKGKKKRKDGVDGQPYSKPTEANVISLLISWAGTKIWSTKQLHMKTIDALEESLLKREYPQSLT